MNNSAVEIIIRYEDRQETTFTRAREGDEWSQTIAGLGLRVTGYDPPNVMRVLSNAVGTREIAK